MSIQSTKFHRQLTFENFPREPFWGNPPVCPWICATLTHTRALAPSSSLSLSLALCLQIYVNSVRSKQGVRNYTQTQTQTHTLARSLARSLVFALALSLSRALSSPPTLSISHIDLEASDMSNATREPLNLRAGVAKRGLQCTCNIQNEMDTKCICIM